MTLRPSLLLALFAFACTAPSETDDKPADTDPDDTGDSAAPVDADGDGYSEADDCDDAVATVNPAATEMCDGIDNNCDGDTDESTAADAAVWYGDTDDDGAGDPDEVVTACTQPDGYLETASDCDDANPAAFPGNSEVCDGADNDCDGTVDEEATDAPTWYADTDGDAFGDPDAAQASCGAPEGHVADGTDCDDEADDIFPGAPEACGDVDHDCDGATDEPESVDVRTWYADGDGDGYGSASFTTDACDMPAGYVADATDCDDAAAGTHPGATDVCDEVDQDCDGSVDEDEPCSDGLFDGTFGSSWETLASSSGILFGLQSFHPSGTLLYDTSASYVRAYDPDADTWTTLSNPAAAYRNWNNMAPWDGKLYGILSGYVYEYTPSSDSWAALTAYSGGDDYNATEVDEDGNLYGYAADGNIVIYDRASGTVSYVSTGLGSLYETRMAYDPTTRGLYFGAFYNPDLYRYDLDDGSISTMTDIPEPQLNDIFCSDHSGHIYAAGDSYGSTMWQYDTATDTWSALPDLPSDHGNNSTCSVSEDGWLYVGTDSGAFYRLELY